MDDITAKKLNVLYAMYVELKKMIAFHPLKRKHIGYENLRKEAGSVYSTVHQIKLDLDSLDISQELKEFLEFFDLASGCLATYLTDMEMFEKGLATRPQLNQDMSDLNHFNKLLIKSSKKFK